MPKPWDISPTEARVIGEQLRPRHEAAIREAADLFRRQVIDALPAGLSSTTTDDDSVKQPSPLASANGDIPILPHFNRLLQLSGFHEPSQLRHTGTWELWSAKEPRPLSSTMEQAAILLLGQRLEERSIATAKTALSDLFSKRSRIVAITAGSSLVTIEQKLKKAFHGRQIAIWTSEGLLASLRERLVLGGGDRYAETKYFVEPSIEPSAQVEGEPPPVSALSYLRDFLAHRAASDVGVLVGEGGLGKSTLALRLCQTIDEAGDHLALLVSENDWLSLETRKIELTLDNIFREALRRKGFRNDDLSQIDVLLANGALTLVFDSFDEVCSRGTNLSPNEVVARILSLSEPQNSRARILLTTRPESWNLVDAALRARCSSFHLQSFKDDQIRAYLSRRFAGDLGGFKRAQNIVSSLGAAELKRLPLILAAISDLVADRKLDDEPNIVSAINRSNPLPGLARLICDREKVKHKWTVNADKQCEFLAVALGEDGPILKKSTLDLYGQAEFDFSTADVDKFDFHGLLQPQDEAKTSFVFRYPELANAIVSDQLAEYLWLMSVGNLPSGEKEQRRVNERVWRLLDRIETDFPQGIVDCGRSLARRRLEPEAASGLWATRATFLRRGQSESALFKVLIEAQRLETRRTVRPTFLASNGSLLVARNFVCGGVLQHLDLRAVRFEGVTFQNTEISTCQFDERSEFDECTFANCSIGRDCSGIASGTFVEAKVDDETVDRSKAWIEFPGVGAERRVDLAVSKVVKRLLKSAGAWKEDSVFTSVSRLADDRLEEYVLQLLKQLSVTSGRGQEMAILPEHQDLAWKIFKQGQFAGPFKAVRQKTTAWFMTRGGGDLH